MNSNYNDISGLPNEKDYLECGLPVWLKESINEMENVWMQLDQGETNDRWDVYYCSLQTDINVAEVEQIISSEQAWYLREKYLRMVRSDEL